MNIGNAVKIGIAVVAGAKLASWSYTACKKMSAAGVKLQFLADKEVPVEAVIFASSEQIDAMVKEYA